MSLVGFETSAVAVYSMILKVKVTDVLELSRKAWMAANFQLLSNWQSVATHIWA